jgi:hypothetical protein
MLNPGSSFSQNKNDTSYVSIAPKSIQQLLVHGKPPVFTLQISGFYDVGLTDLAANDNTNFNKENFVKGKDFGTRYGYGGGLTGKISLHKAGNVRLLVSAFYNRFQSDFVISKTPEGKVVFNIFTGGIGIENNFTPARKFKYFVGFQILSSLIYGNAVLATDTVDFHLKVKNAFRIGLSGNIGFEYAFTNSFGVNLGFSISHANVLLRQNKASSDISETYLNDDKTNLNIPYAGWKNFFYATFYGGINFYFGMKNKK